MPEDQELTLPPLEERPLVTFALFAYNQEKYIREAVESALAQTYSPLEIILSDDCSTDKTFEIMRTISEEYCGPHKIRLNRNQCNIGISAHVSKIDIESQGVLIIHAAGDDISLPVRTESIVKYWINSPKKPSVIVSNGINFTDKGEILGSIISRESDIIYERLYNPFLAGKNIKYLGCTLALEKALVCNFGLVSGRAVSEDVITHWRAHIMNGVLYIPDVLVMYRFGLGISRLFNVTRENVLINQLQQAQDKVVLLSQFYNDIDRIDANIKKIYLKSIALSNKYHFKRKIKVLQASISKSAFYFIIDLILFPRKWSQFKEDLRIFLIKWYPSLVNIEL